MGLSAGTRLGPYEIVVPLGAGGMGEVYRARDTRLGRDVAVKVVHPRLASDPERLSRFEKEARAAAQLDHPNILVVHDVGSHEGSPFIVSELLQGESLREKLGSPLPPKKAVDYAIQIARGLAAAHEKGIVHRDIKPENVFVTKDGRVKILDFGVAKLLPSFEPSGVDTQTPTESATQPGTALGTVSYMSPEQIRGQPVDARTDLFSFGVVLYEMLSGKRPFQRDTVADTMSAILREEPLVLTGAGQGTPPILDKIVRHCLEKDSSVRTQSAREVIFALETLSTLSGEAPAQTAAPVQTDTWLRRHQAALAGAALLIAAIAGGGLWWKSRVAKPAAPLDPKRIVVAVFENRTGDPSLDPLGRQAAESIIGGLSKVTTVKVLPSSTVLPASAGGTGAASKRDPVHALAESTGAGVVVSGAYYLEGPTIQIQAKVTEVSTAKLLWPIDPASAPREKAGEAVETIRQRLLDVVAARYLADGVDMLVLEGRPPRYEAAVERVKGNSLFGSDLPGALAHFRHAIDLDPGFLLPRLGAAWALFDIGRFADADAELDRLEEMKDRMTPTFRRRFDTLRANVAGRWEEIYSIASENFARSPGLSTGGQLAEVAFETNRPRAAVKILQKPLGWETEQTTDSPIGLYDFTLMTGSLHQLGQHEEELKEARRGRGIYPDLLNSWAYEARALVALERLDEVEKLINEAVSMPPRWGYESCCMQRGTPGFVMLAAAEELRAHGHRDASLKMANRAADWYRSRTGHEAERSDNRRRHGEALYMAELWPEAKVVFAALAAEEPAYVNAKGWLGAIAARQGNTAEARRVSAELGALDPKYLFGIDALWQAQIAAILGDKDGAVALLRESVARGYGWSKERESYGYGFLYQHLMDLESLRGYPPFEELVKPKG